MELGLMRSVILLFVRWLLVVSFFLLILFVFSSSSSCDCWLFLYWIWTVIIWAWGDEVLCFTRVRSDDGMWMVNVEMVMCIWAFGVQYLIKQFAILLFFLFYFLKGYRQTSNPIIVWHVWWCTVVYGCDWLACGKVFSFGVGNKYYRQKCKRKCLNKGINVISPSMGKSRSKG